MVFYNTEEKRYFTIESNNRILEKEIALYSMKINGVSKVVLTSKGEKIIRHLNNEQEKNLLDTLSECLKDNDIEVKFNGLNFRNLMTVKKKLS